MGIKSLINCLEKRLEEFSEKDKALHCEMTNVKSENHRLINDLYIKNKEISILKKFSSALKKHHITSRSYSPHTSSSKQIDPDIKNKIISSSKDSRRDLMKRRLHADSPKYSSCIPGTKN